MLCGYASKYLLSLYQLDEPLQSNAADFQILLHGIICTILVLLQRSFALFGPNDLGT